MSCQIFKCLLLVATFGSIASLEQHGTAKIGEKCERDRNCIEHSYCRAQMTCLCDQYYSPTLDNSRCIASAGLGCTNDYECSTMSNAVCRQGVCACKDSYVLDINNSSNCVGRPSKVGDPCQRTDECQDAMGRAFCINEQCQCVTSYHFANQTGQCVQSRTLYNQCRMDYECISFNNENVLECRNGECVCKQGEETCNKGSAIAVFEILVALLPVILRLI